MDRDAMRSKGVGLKGQVATPKRQHKKRLLSILFRYRLCHTAHLHRCDKQYQEEARNSDSKQHK